MQQIEEKNNEPRVRLTFSNGRNDKQARKSWESHLIFYERYVGYDSLWKKIQEKYGGKLLFAVKSTTEQKEETQHYESLLLVHVYRGKKVMQTLAPGVNLWDYFHLIREELVWLEMFGRKIAEQYPPCKVE